MLQIRTWSGPYNPDRDIINLFPRIAKTAAYAMGRTAWGPMLGDYLEFKQVQEADLCPAAAALAEFINETYKPEADSVETALYKAGFYKLSIPAQLAVLAKVGQVALASYYMYTREANPANFTDPLLDAARGEADRAKFDLKRPLHKREDRDLPENRDGE